MSKYFVFKKDNIAIQAIKSKEILTSEIFEVEEITKSEFLSLSLPCKKIEGIWTKADEMPEIEYPELEPIEESEKIPTPEERIEALEAAVKMLCMADVK